MRYYTYVSDAKLDQLYGQLPRRLSSRFLGEAKLDVKVASMSLKNAEQDVTRFERLRLVERYVEKNYDVGWWTDPNPWFRGELGLRAGVFRGAGAVLFTGLDQDTLVALIGSSRHLVERETPPGHSSLEPPSSNLPALVTLLKREGAEYRAVREGALYDERREDTDEQTVLRQAVAFALQMRGPRQPCEFLARRLLEGSTTGLDGQALHVVIGTPLYVALSDEE